MTEQNKMPKLEMRDVLLEAAERIAGRIINNPIPMDLEAEIYAILDDGVGPIVRAAEAITPICDDANCQRQLVTIHKTLVDRLRDTVEVCVGDPVLCRDCRIGDHSQHWDSGGICGQDNRFNADCQCPYRDPDVM